MVVRITNPAAHERALLGPYSCVDPPRYQDAAVLEESGVAPRNGSDMLPLR